MPPARRPAELPLPVRLQRMDEDRLRGYRANLDFYQGSQWLGRARRGERRLTFNYARALVDKVTSYLLTESSVQVEARDGDAAEGRARARAAEGALREAEALNGLAQLDYETELDCAVLGDAAYKVTWDVTERAARVSAPDVQGIFAWRVPDDPSRVLAVASQYRLAPGGPPPAQGELVTEHGRRRRSSCGAATTSRSARRTRTGSSRSSSSRTCASRSRRGARATCRRSSSRAAS